MLQQQSSARQRAFSTAFARVSGLAILALGLLGVVTPAYGLGQAAIGIYRCSKAKFFLDGNNDGIVDLRPVLTSPPAVCGAASNSYGLAADFTGSGVKQPVTYLAGNWSVDKNFDGTADSTFNWGIPGDVPLVADMDGDGIDDPVVYRNGWWYVSSGTTPGVLKAAYAFGGAPGDIPLLADFNGDGVPDLVIYRGGTWFVSTTRTGVASLIYNHGGAPGDIPIAFDYDGDGVPDLVIYRAGVWYVSTHRDGLADAIFVFGGTAGDVPLYLGRGAVSTPDLDAARFLNQAAFGPTPAEVGNVKSMGYSAWINNQFTKPMTVLTAMPYVPVDQNQFPNCKSPYVPGPGDPIDSFGTNCPRDFYSLFQVQRGMFMNALYAPDQLRQRVAWALSQILVTSGSAGSEFQVAYAMRDYQQTLMNNAFGNYHDLLINISISPFMGNFLDMVNNDKANPVTGQQPNENYAREIMQLFSIGTLEIDTTTGGLLLDAQGQPIQTYDQTDINNLAKVMTGWTYYPKPGVATVTWNMPVNYQSTMVRCEGASTFCLTGGASINHHDTTVKTVLGYTAPGGLTADTDLATFVSAIFYHPNLGYTVGKQLIQHLVISNPSNAYVKRVAAKFNDNGAGVRGDMKAVIMAVLMDPEARAPRNPIGAYGKLKEPVTMLAGFLRNLAPWDTSDGVAATAGGVLPAMGQDIYQAPTVFNYYPADYIIPGTTLAGPQFGIWDPTTVFARTNTLYNWTLGAACGAAALANVCGPNPDATVAGSVGTKIDWTVLASSAANAATLVDNVSWDLLYTTLPRGLRQQIINAVNGVAVSTPPTAAQLRDRARTAVYLIASSPKYQLEY